MKKIILALICLLAVSVCAGAACATSDVDNMDIDDSNINQDIFVSVDIGDHDFNCVYPVNQNECNLDNDGGCDDLDNSYAAPENIFVSVDIGDHDFNCVYPVNQNECNLDNDGVCDDLDNSYATPVCGFDPVSSVSDDLDYSCVDGSGSSAMYFQSVKWIIPAKELNHFINFWIPTQSVPDSCSNDLNTIVRFEKDVEPVRNLNCIFP